jgi:hypothetical protein
MGKKKSDRGHDRTEDQRAVSPLVGVVLLIGIVAIAALAVFVTGASMLDAFESDANAEQAQQVMTEMDHRIATVAATGKDQQLPDEGTITNDGAINVTWYNASTGARCSPVQGKLRALEFEVNDRTIAHQGGGIWQKTENGVTVVSEPQIKYNGNSLRLQILQLEEGNFTGSETVAKANHSKATSLTRQINTAASGCPDATDIEVEIESSYYEGWTRYLEDTVGASNVTAYAGNETVEMKIQDVRNPASTPTVLIKSDDGLKNTVGSNQRVEYGDPLKFQATLNNTGNKSVNPPMKVSIKGGAIIEAGSGAVPSGQTKQRSVIVNSYSSTLKPGQTYEYTIESLDNSGTVVDTLESPGKFYLGKSGTHFNVTDSDVATTATGDGNVTISTKVTNHGVTKGNQTVTLEFEEYNVTASEELTLDYGANGTVSWTVNQSALPIGSNAFEIRTGGDTANGTVIGTATGGEEAFVVVEDKGVGDDQVLVDGDPFSVDASVVSTYASNETRTVNLTIPKANVDRSKPVTLKGGEKETVSFSINPDTDDFEPGTVYDYNVVADGSGLSKTGSFYVGTPGTNFELSNENATVDDNVTITADLKNTGVDSGSQTVTVDLEYLGDMPADLEDEDPYGRLFDGDINRSFGESDAIELELNGSKLLDGEYEATIQTEDGSQTVNFVMEAGIDPGTVGVSGLENANVTVDVVGSQVSGGGTNHFLAPMTLQVMTNGTEEYSFTNPSGGDNINTGPTWQDKSDGSYTYSFQPENNVSLTLRNTRYEICSAQTTSSSSLSQYTGPYSEFQWCTDVSGSTTFGPIDATQGKNLQNVRVRSAENNSIPALPAGEEQQLSATEALEKRGLVKNENELDLGPGEVVFLFENTADCGPGCDEDDIDALWDDAVGSYEANPDETADPNFNDLIVYVDVDRANVDPGKPSITIVPTGGDSTDVATGDGYDAGGVGEVAPSFEADTDEGSAPDVGTGDSNPDDAGSVAGNTGIEIETDHIVIG